MHARTLSTALALLLMSCGADEPVAPGSGQPQDPAAPSLDRLAPSSLLGDGWHPGTMLVVTDWQQLDALDATQRATAEMLRGPMQKQGVTGIAELSWSRKQMPIDMLSVRVLRFADAAKLRSWRQLKYGGLRDAELKPVEGAPFETYDVLADGKHKRIVFFDEVFVSSHHVQKGDDHVAALDAVCAQLLAGR
ncbi:MAG: hypothetical protein ACE37K_22875 [Planctomycetota bacterium]